MGTETQLIRFITTVKELRKDETKYIYFVFFDLKSAFDMVPWRKLFQRLVEYNFPVDLISKQSKSCMGKSF